MENIVTDRVKPSAFQHIEVDEINKIDLVCHKYDNLILLIITQLEKISSIYSVKNQTYSDGFVNPAKIYDIKQKFGEFISFSNLPALNNNSVFVIVFPGCPSDEAEAAIRILMNFVTSKDEVIFALGLKKIDHQILKAIQDRLLKIPVLQPDK